MKQAEAATQEVLCKKDAPENLAKPTGINTRARVSPSTKPQAIDQQLYQKIDPGTRAPQRIPQNAREHSLLQSISSGYFRRDKKKW